jgi:hypothetical protein
LNRIFEYVWSDQSLPSPSKVLETMQKLIGEILGKTVEWM